MSLDDYPILGDVNWDASQENWDIDPKLSNKPGGSYPLIPHLTYEGAGNEKWNVRTVMWKVPENTRDFRMYFEISGGRTHESCTADAEVYVDIEYESTPGLFARRKILTKNDRNFNTYGPWKIPEIINNNFYNGRRFVFISKERNWRATVTSFTNYMEVFNV